MNATKITAKKNEKVGDHVSSAIKANSTAAVKAVRVTKSAPKQNASQSKPGSASKAVAQKPANTLKQSSAPAGQELTMQFQ